VKIAVIIPTLNEEQALPGTLARTARLGFDEIIVVDGGSSDRTCEIVKPLCINRDPSSVSSGAASSTDHASRITLLASSKGRAKQMNAGASQSQAGILLFLHADTRLPDGARQAIERALSEPACVGGHFDVRFEHDAGLAWLIARLISLRSRWSGIATGDQAIFVRREVFATLGGFADIPLMEDLDFARRLKQAGRTAPLRAQVVTSYRRWERYGAVRIIVLMWTLRFLYWIGIHPSKLHRFYTVVR
jgi:rSAM/selenodomain-associated transferase 2